MRAAFALTSVALLAFAAWYVSPHLFPHDSISLVSSSLANVEARIEEYKLDTGRLPTHLDDLLQSHGQHSAYASREDLLDPWGRKFEYQSFGSTFVLFTLGADGKRGGSGASEDQHVGTAADGS